VAMVILVLLLSLTFVLLFRFSTSGHTSKKLKYEMAAAELAYRTKQEKSFLDEEAALDEVLLSKKVLPYADNLLLLQIDILQPAGDTLGSHKELIYEAN